jgi:hypothetical protein
MTAAGALKEEEPSESAAATLDDDDEEEGAGGPETATSAPLSLAEAPRALCSASAEASEAGTSVDDFAFEEPPSSAPLELLRFQEMFKFASLDPSACGDDGAAGAGRRGLETCAGAGAGEAVGAAGGGAGAGDGAASDDDGVSSSALLPRRFQPMFKPAADCLGVDVSLTEPSGGGGGAFFFTSTGGADDSAPAAGAGAGAGSSFLGGGGGGGAAAFFSPSA